VSIDDAATLERLHELFLGLANGDPSEAELIGAIGATPVHPLSIRLKSSRGAQGRKRLRSETKTASFVWHLTPEGWNHCADLIEGLRTHGPGAHQYLTDEELDDALIEVAFAESR
jgi:hypothetical protein